MNNTRYPLMFNYACEKYAHRTNGEEGVYEDLLTNATVQEGLANARKLWPGAESYKVSDIQLSLPYQVLFWPDRYDTTKLAQWVLDNTAIGHKPLKSVEKEFGDLVRHLDELNK